MEGPMSTSQEYPIFPCAKDKKTYVEFSISGACLGVCYEKECPFYTASNNPEKQPKVLNFQKK